MATGPFLAGELKTQSVLNTRCLLVPPLGVQEATRSSCAAKRCRGLHQSGPLRSYVGQSTPQPHPQKINFLGKWLGVGGCLLPQQSPARPAQSIALEKLSHVCIGDAGRVSHCSTVCHRGKGGNCLTSHKWENDNLWFNHMTEYYTALKTRT